MRLLQGGAEPRVPPPMLQSLGARQELFVTYLQKGSAREAERFFERLNRLDGVNIKGTSSTRVNDESKNADALLLDQMATRDLSGVSLAAVMIDGTPVGKRCVLWALGVTMDGTKVPLGIYESATENTEAVEALLTNLIVDRHLDPRDVLWVIDGGRALRGGIRALTHGRAAIQRCVVHKSRNVVSDNLRAKDRKVIGGEALWRLAAAWHEPDYDIAAERLADVAKWLKQKGHEAAAKSVLEGVEMTLTLQRLGIDDPQIRTVVNQTNMIESVHRAVSERKGGVKMWQDDDMRQRHVAAAIACAEDNWSKVGPADPFERRAALERMSLTILSSRHPEIGMTIDNSVGDRMITLTDLRVAPEDQRKIHGTLKDLRAWAERNGKALEISDHAIDAAPSPRLLRAWIEREGTGEVSRLARARQRPADPLAVAREGTPNALAAPLAEAALAAAPAMVAMDDLSLKRTAATLWAARDGLLTIEAEVQAWWDDDKRAAARQIAHQRVQVMRGEQEPRHPLAGGRAKVLGDARAAELMGISSYKGGVIEGLSPEAFARDKQAVSAVLERLDGPVERLVRAGEAVAACRELDRRELFKRVEQDSASDREARARPRPGSAPLDRYQAALGHSRGGLLRSYADALAPQLEELEPAALARLREEIGNPWDDLDAGSALRTVKAENRDRPDMVRRRAETQRELAQAERLGEPERAARLRETAGKQLKALGELATKLEHERASERSLDRFVAEHPEAALDHALQVELERRRELEAPERAAPEPEVVVTPPPVEMAM